MCKGLKPLDEFYRNKGTKDGYHCECKKCNSSQEKIKRKLTSAKRHPERQAHPCKECQNIFMPRYNGGPVQIYCSAKCKRKSHYRIRTTRPGYKRPYGIKEADNSAKIQTANKKRALEGYGGCICSCCGEKELAFLTIDHINGGGTKHRRMAGFGADIYRWLWKNNFPPGFRVLCMNCNFATKHGRLCPHQIAKREKYGNNKTSNQ